MNWIYYWFENLLFQFLLTDSKKQILDSFIKEEVKEHCHIYFKI